MGQHASLNKEFVGALLGLLMQPSCQTEIFMTIFFPEVKQEFDTWLRGHVITPPNGADVYDWLQKKFPEAPLRSQLAGDPDVAFRCLLKAILAKAMNIPYPNMPMLMIPRGD